MPDVQTKSILITGCSSGIGLEAALHLKSLGFAVVASARKTNDVSRLKALGINAVYIDAMDLASVESGLERALSIVGGRFYGCYHNCGYGQSGALEDLPSVALLEQFHANVIGAHEINRRLIGLMRQVASGRIVFNSSVLGLMAMRFRGAYAMSKFAMEAMADTLRLELSGSGVHVSLIEPGPISTNFRRNSLAAFNRYIDAEKSVHANDYKRFIERLTKTGNTSRFTLPPGACLPPLIDALTSSNPKARYPVTVPTKLVSVLKRVMPTFMLDRLAYKNI